MRRTDADKQTGMHASRQAGRQLACSPHKQAVKQTDRQMDRRQTSRQASKQTVWSCCPQLLAFWSGILPTRPWGYKTWVHSQTQNKAQWLAACGHVSASNQSLFFILNQRLCSSFITSMQGLLDKLAKRAYKQVKRVKNQWTHSDGCLIILTA